MNEESSVNLVLETLGVDPQREREATSSKLSGETLLGTDTVREGIPIDIDR